jgi:tight adherence protein B
VFDLNVTVLAMIVLVMLSAGGIAYAMFFDKAESENLTQSRIGRIVASGAPQPVEDGSANRRRTVQSALKDFEEKVKAREKQSKSPPLGVRLSQAGLSWTKKTFFIVSGVFGVVFLLLGWLGGGNLLVGLGCAVVGALGFPNWLVNFLRKRRQNKFLDEFPNAVDLIVRGVRSGLPLGDCIRMIATETRDPVAGEFRQIIESTQLGVTVSDACMALYDRMPLQEANFFGIVISIQQKAGGNLSEALANLSKVLRDRRKMKAKIAAMSMEAKASAYIIGSLPFIVTGLVYMTSPSYIMLLFTSHSGNMILLGSGLYMAIGVFVMRQMIQFDF